MATSETPRGELLLEARELITGDRNQTYGSPTQNFQNTADLLNIQFRHKLKPGKLFTPTDVAVMMMQLKLARLVAQPKRDNFVDIAGYAACGWECVEAEKDTSWPTKSLNGKRVLNASIRWLAKLAWWKR